MQFQGAHAIVINEQIIRRTLRVPAPAGPEGDGATATRQFDAVLMSAGFKLSDELFTRLSGYSEGVVIDTAVEVLAAVRKMVGDHVQHNVYFRDFPRNVPDTIEFWAECIIEALADPEAVAQVGGNLLLGTLNLLSLPKYGRYQHSYAEMLAAQPAFIESAGDRITVLHAGGTLAEEASALYLRMAAATTPGNDDDLNTLKLLALACATDAAQPQEIPVRENRAVINEIRLGQRVPLLVDTVTDVLRLASAVSGGDVTLAEPTRFARLSRPVRRALLSALNDVVGRNANALGDVNQYAERWKRLGERLKPHEHPRYPHAAEVFAVARGELAAPSLGGEVEQLMGRRDGAGAATLLRKAAPGRLFRAADWLVRTDTDQAAVASIITDAVEDVSGRVLLGLREHLGNRGTTGGRRLFVNRFARAHAEPDTRARIDSGVVADVTAALDAEIGRRLAGLPPIVADPGITGVALPLSGKAVAAGFGTLPRGSRTIVDGQLLRFFTYWRQNTQRTDFDLSALMLNRNYTNPMWLSYTNLRGVGAVHSGDITSAPTGASEFIDLDLSKLTRDVIVPQVNVYTGEGFDEVAESFFGYMTRDRAQDGAPFEPRTVRMKSELRGAGRVALPLVFIRDNDVCQAVWVHLHLMGRLDFNQVENNRVSTTTMVRSILEREYLTVGYLANLKNAGGAADSEPVTFIGFQDPGDLPNGSVVVTPETLGDLIPA